MPDPRLVTSTQYTNLRLPTVVRAGNTIARSWGALVPPRPLDAEALLAAARASTGLADAGDPAFVPALQTLVASINQEAHLHPLGRAIVAGRLRGMLENRLRVEALIAEHPEIAAAPVHRPIVIAGLQRTGTTMLHRLLAADPEARSLAGWEALSPAPLPGEGRTAFDKRRAAGKRAEAGLAWMSPAFFAIHPVETDAPEEDILLLDHAFMSQASEAILHVPAYAAWLEAQDSVPAYRYLRRCLQVLQWQRAGAWWVLKTPHHLEYLTELLTVFPDAVVVQTHRDPQATMGSFCSMVAHGGALFTDEIQPREIGRHWLRKVRRMLDRSAAARAAAPDTPCVDVSYYALLQDPIAQVRRIYAAAGRELTPAAEAAMRAVLARDTQHRYGRHAYDAAAFGLSRCAIDAAFDDYRARFQIPHESSGSREALLPPSRVTGVGHRTVLRATVTAFIDLAGQRRSLTPLDAAVRLDGQTALVTGSNTGLGKAVAMQLAQRGARVLMACRSGIPEAGHDVARASGSALVEMVRVDLSDLDSVAALARDLESRGERIDLYVGNAGLMPNRSQSTRQGYEIMVGVHYLANHLLLRLLLRSGVIPNAVFSTNGRPALHAPRIVLVSSETHRSAPPLDLAQLGAPVSYGMQDVIVHYGSSKLALSTFTTELSRRLTTATGPSVAVHGLCPGPIASSITRDAPAFLQPLVEAGMRQVFPLPAPAAEPVVYLAAAPELAGESGWYLHLMNRKAASPAASDPALGSALWDRGEAMLAPWLG